MSYTIIKTDGTLLTTIANGTINTTSTSVALPGRNYAGYGQYVDTNFAHMIENFANTGVPSNPLRGQLWYNTSTNTMCICPTDGETTAANWYTITTTSSGGNATFGNLTITGNLLANNITATNQLNANSISCNYLTVNVNATMANANFTGTANAATFKTTAITSGSQSTPGILTGVWTANGAGTPAGGVAGTSLYVIGGNLVISNASSRGIVADFFYYSNGTAITFGGSSYSNANVAAYLPTYTGDVGNVSTTATNRLFAATLSTGAAATAGSIVGNWSLGVGSNLVATTVSTAAQPNITSVGVLTSLAVTANITAGNVNANSGTVRGLYLAGDGSNITNISVAAGTSIVNGTSNVVVSVNGNVTMGVSGTPSVLLANSAGVNIAGYANITGTAFIGANANVTGNVNAGNLLGIFANGTSNVRIPAVNGNVNISSAGTANVVVVTNIGANITGYANVTTSLSVGTTATIAGNISASSFVGPLSNGSTSNINMDAAGNVRTVAAGTTRLTVTTSGANITGYANVTGALSVGTTATIAGNVTAPFFIGNGSALTGITVAAGSSIINGDSSVAVSANSSVTTTVNSSIKMTATSTAVQITNANLTVAAGFNANIPLIISGTSNITLTSGGNISTSVGGVANIFVAKTTGANITGTLGTLGNMTIYSNAGNTTSAPYMFLQTGNTAGKRSGIVYRQTATDQFELGVDISVNNSRNFYIYDSVAPAVRLFIDPNGNVGIANTAPAHTLSVTGTVGVSGAIVSTLAVGTAPFTVTSTTQVANLNVATAGTVITAAQPNITSVTTSGGAFTVGTSANGGAYFSQDSLVLNSHAASGTEGAQIVLAYANTFGLTGAGANTWNIDVTSANTFRIFRNTSTVTLDAVTIAPTTGNMTVTGNILCANDVVAYSSSDSRLKENIVPIENALAKIKKISGVMFDWKDGHEIDRKHDTGLIAQEVEEVLPEVVVTRSSGYKAVRYEKIMGLVVQAIKELSDQVDELKKKL